MRGSQVRILLVAPENMRVPEIGNPFFCMQNVPGMYLMINLQIQYQVSETGVMSIPFGKYSCSISLYFHCCPGVHNLIHQDCDIPSANSQQFLSETHTGGRRKAFTASYHAVSSNRFYGLQEIRRRVERLPAVTCPVPYFCVISGVMGEGGRPSLAAI